MASGIDVASAHAVAHHVEQLQREAGEARVPEHHPKIRMQCGLVQRGGGELQSRQRQWRSPYYWAAFVLQGEWK